MNNSTSLSLNIIIKLPQKNSNYKRKIFENKFDKFKKRNRLKIQQQYFMFTFKKKNFD